jgi:hypothetical protein
MLSAFAGPSQPLTTSGRRRNVSRRGFIIASAVLALGIFVPASLALVASLSQTPRQFVADQGEPLNARKAIETYIRRGDAHLARLQTIRRVVSTTTGDETIYLYALTFSGGLQGTALISGATNGIAGMGYGMPSTCPPGWALQGSTSAVERPGTTPLLVSGRTAADVISVAIIYPDGHTSPAAVANGYFLAAVTPNASPPRTAPAVTLVAYNAAGAPIGRLNVSADGGIRPAPGQASQAVPCG